MGQYSDEAIADMLGDDWESYICPLAGPGNATCYVDRNSKECQKCQEDYLKAIEEQEHGKA